MMLRREEDGVADGMGDGIEVQQDEDGELDGV